MESLIHIANILVLLSFIVADMFWLRALQVVASVAFSAYFAYHSLHAPIGWNAVFTLVNGYHLVRLYLERRPIALTAEKRQLYLRVFQNISARKYLSILDQGTWRSASRNTCLVQAGQHLDELLLIADGRVAVEIDGDEVSRMGPGSFIGEMSYITGQPASAGITALTDVRLVAWPSAALGEFLDEQTDLRSAMQEIIGADLVGKLRAARSDLDMSLVRSTTGKLRTDAALTPVQGELDRR